MTFFNGRWASLFFFLFIFLGLTACEIGKNKFGGTQEASTGGGGVVTSDTIAKNLIDSTVTLFKIDSTSIVGSPTAITKLTNLKTTFDTSITGPLDLTPDSSMISSVTGDILHLEPGVSQAQFLSPLDKSITGSSASIFVVLNSGSSGHLLSFNSFDRQSQSFGISVSGSTATGIFYSSAADYISADLPLPSSGLGIVGVAFGEEGEIDFSVNGTLNHTPASTGTPGTPFTVPRVLSLGPANTGESVEFKELYMFGRSLTRTEQGALITYLGKKHNIAVTLDPLLNVPVTGGGGGSTTDPNFAPAQAIIESKCLTCHSSWSGVRASYYVNLGLVNKNDPTNSKLYYRLIGSSGANGPKTMPQGGSISASDLSVIETWITNMP